MEPNSQPAPVPKPTSQPVMDIKAPARVSASEPVKTPPAEPGMAAPESVAVRKNDDKKAKPPKPSKTHGSSVGLAIVATVLIVLGLGLLFIYAYIQQNGH
ncbi:MAG TPA: hypothetical protein VN778_04655 [Verrucomicrobiae bacterium]|nr:hypothetical protein [Verrucomicrobiae bacterium]